MMVRTKITATLLLFVSATGWSQTDSIKTQRLEEVTVEGQKLYTIERLPKIKGTYLWSGKKNEVINVQDLDANVTEKTPRQIFSKVPGVFVYDMDGTGNQMNISTRGLDPHRGWEFNVRKNGIITNSDMYGYPASHYSMPMEAVDHIELVRGTGSLQYGAQFGGMLNYVSRKPDTTRAFIYENVNSIGSFNTVSSHHSITGMIGKIKYRAYYNKRVSDGYRDNSSSDFQAQSILLNYSPSRNLDITAELSRSKYVHQLPGPLTDSMFYANPQHATRSRSFYSPDIYVPSVTVNWDIGSKTRLSWVTSAVLGVRSSALFNAAANVPDAINPATLEYAPRVVDVDHYNSYTSELRILHQYTIGKLPSALSGGIQLMNNDQHRQQLGVGTTGTDFDVTITGLWGRDLHYKTSNVALFAENSFWVTPDLVVTPGMRFELGKTSMSGVINYYDPGDVPQSLTHEFPLFGINAEYTTNHGNSLYAGWSQAYRPVIFQDIIPATTYDVVDDNLVDAQGYNFEAGYRGSFKGLRWDVGVFMLLYENRPGTLAGDATGDGSFYILRTSIGDALTRGLELFFEYPFYHGEKSSFTMFTSTALFDSQYKNAVVRSGSDNVSIAGNKVESVPDVITRNGVTFRHDQFSVSLLYSYTSESFADPLNTVNPSASGSVGLVPAYGLLDFNTSIKVYENILVRLNINNVLDKQYFTKRPEFYPGPGIWSSDGRSINCSVAFKI